MVPLLTKGYARCYYHFGHVKTVHHRFRVIPCSSVKWPNPHSNADLKRGIQKMNFLILIICRKAYKIFAVESNMFQDLKNAKHFLRSFDILRSWDQETESSMKEEAGDARQTEVGVVNPAIACAHFSCNGYLCLYLCGKQIQIQKTR